MCSMITSGMLLKHGEAASTQWSSVRVSALQLVGRGLNLWSSLQLTAPPGHGSNQKSTHRCV